MFYDSGLGILHNFETLSLKDGVSQANSYKFPQNLLIAASMFL